MRYVVLQPFQTPMRRFSEGILIDDNEIDGPLHVADWVERGYLRAPPVAEEVSALRDEALGLGIEIDGRWGGPRLREAIEAKKAEQQAAEEALLAEDTVEQTEVRAPTK